MADTFILPGTSLDDSGNATFDGTVTAAAFAGAVTGDVTGTASGNTIVATATVNYDDTSATVLWTVPSGKVWYIRSIEAFVATGFDGTSADLDIGTTSTASGSNDPDGLIDGSSVTNFPGTTNVIAGQEHDELGALLWDGTNDHGRTPVLTAGQEIAATITPGSGASEGVVSVLLRYDEVTV